MPAEAFRGRPSHSGREVLEPGSRVGVLVATKSLAGCRTADQLKSGGLVSTKPPARFHRAFPMVKRLGTVGSVHPALPDKFLAGHNPLSDLFECSERR